MPAQTSRDILLEMRADLHRQESKIDKISELQTGHAVEIQGLKKDIQYMPMTAITILIAAVAALAAALKALKWLTRSNIKEEST